MADASADGVAAERWAASTRALREEARLIGGDWPATEPGFYVAAELRQATDSIERGTVALVEGDRVTGVLHARLMVETMIRLAWVKAPIQQRDRSQIAGRLRRLLEQDTIVLLAADDAVRKHAGFAMIKNRDEIMRQIAEMSTPAVEPAPSKLAALAGEVGLPGPYGVFRLLSSLSHPGLGQKIGARSPDEWYWRYLRYSHAGAVLFGVGLLDGLGVLESSAELPLNEAAFRSTGALSDPDDSAP